MEPAPLSSLQEEGEGEPAWEDSSAFSPAAVPPRPATHHSLQKYAPLDWSAYFDEERRFAIPGTDDVFNVYTAGSEGPVVFCLHGGGYSGQACATDECRNAAIKLLLFLKMFAIDLDPRLSFALAARQMKDKARVVAMDLRGHGKSTTSNDLDLSIETLTNDVIAVIRAMYGDSPPAIILVGHSMGGSVAVHVAARREIQNLHGLVVIDVVEGTAMASLVHMQKILSNRAQHFPSIEKAIEWSVKGGPLRNIESARVSIPSTLKYDESREWYEGLSDKFLSCPVQKILLLAGTDRLYRALTIGQMQGKFQTVVVRHTGHAIQEDVPEEFASHILYFISRNKIGPSGVEPVPVHGVTIRGTLYSATVDKDLGQYGLCAFAAVA
ncbi:protein phosphatase methylesterase 1 [Panicum miliaceum]|uniref:Protein phosphatase methylesterase 1 n=1 Tax=Panicum miliaceum TaxID=4540 RepID=A0A3L6Q9K9_PANMI|nr:protein phosphatase methylesterase 1 [Panicum miliaceum]